MRKEREVSNELKEKGVNINTSRTRGYYVEKYNKMWDTRVFNAASIELWCFVHDKRGEGVDGRLTRWDHYRNAVDELWNRNAASPRKVIWNEWSEEMARGMIYNKYCALAGSASSGKCFGGDVLVRMADGTKMRADWLAVGDRVMGVDGLPRTIVEAHNGYGPMYQVIQDTKDVWTCNGEHVLCLRKGDKKSDISVNEYLTKSDTYRALNHMYSGGYDLPERALPIEPRMFGIWLGDGDTRRSSITQHFDEVGVIDYMYAWAKRNDYDVKIWRSSNENTSHFHFSERPHGLNVKGKTRKLVRDSRFNALIKKSTISGVKRIPEEYLLGSYEQRMELLAGIIDTDGYAAGTMAGKEGTYYDITLSNEMLLLDVKELAVSLGFKCKFRHRVAKLNGKDFNAWRLTICGDVSKVPCFRKTCRKAGRINDNIRFDITPVGDGEFYGFEVDGDHKFLLANGTVVHNSDGMAVYSIVQYMAAPFTTKVVVSSTTIKMAHLRIWRSVTELWLPSFPGNMIYSRCLIKGMDPKAPDSYCDGTGIGLIPPAGGLGVEIDSNFLGIKQDRLIVMLDEFSELPLSVLNACYSNLSNNKYFEMKAASNPNMYHDSFGVFAKPKAGWASVTEKDRQWETSRGICIRFDAEDSPNMKLGENKYPWLPSKEAIEQAKGGFW